MPVLIEIHDDFRPGPFADAILWSGWIVIGLGTRVHFITPSDGQVTTFSLGESGFEYFGDFYPYADFLLVASGVALMRLDRAGRLVWQTDGLAVDGVIVERVEDGVIYGQAEWDPPGSWIPFTISLDTGRGPAPA